MRSFLWLSVLAFSAATLPASAAEDPSFAGQAARSVGRCFRDSAIGMIHLDLTRFNASRLPTNSTALMSGGVLGLNPPALEAFASIVEGLHSAGAEHLYILFNPTPMTADNPYFVILSKPGTEPSALLQKARQHGQAATFIGDAVVIAGGSVLSDLQARTPVARPDLEAALRAAADAPVAAYLVPSADQQQALEATLPQLPPLLGGGPTTVLTRGLKWAAIGYAPERKAVNLVIKSQDAAAAQALRDYLKMLPGRVSGVAWLKSLFPEGRLPGQLVPVASGDMLTLKLDQSNRGVQSLQAGFAEAGKTIQRAVNQTARKNHIKQIMLAMHNYHDINRRFPAAATYDKGGRPLLSWRVCILPFVEENALYKQFHLDEPWDSEHNKKLIAKIPDVYAARELKPEDQGKTTLLGIVGAHSAFHDHEGTKIREITDGTSNTIMILDAPPELAVPWTKPEDFDADAPHARERLLGNRDGFWTGFGDGSARFLSIRISEKTLRALFTINGGEVIDSAGF